MRSWLGRAAFLGRAGWLGLAIAFGVVARSSPAWAEGKSVEQASAAEKASAQAKFKEASAHFRASRWNEAILGFRESYDIVKSPNSYVMLGRAQRKAGRLVEAHETLQQAADEARALASRMPKYNQAARTADAELAEIKPELALLSVDAPAEDGLSLSVDGRRIPQNRWKSIPVMPGKVEVVLSAADGREARRTIDAVASREQPVKLELSAPAEPAGTGAAAAAGTPPPQVLPSRSEDEPPVEDRGTGHPLRPYAYVAAGVGALGIATFVVAGSMARSTENDLEANCPANRCPRGLEDKVDEGRTQQTVANIGLAVGIIGAATAVTLFVSDRSSPSAESARRKSKSGARLELGGSPKALFLRGVFE